jgi:hypothetical protein
LNVYFHGLLITRQVKGDKVFTFAVSYPTGAAASPKPVTFVLGDDINAVGGFAFYLEPELPLVVVGQCYICSYAKCG